jgi:S1-C subfamily serine protease
MRTRIAILCCLAAVSQPAVATPFDFDLGKSHTEAEWDAYYSFDNPNLTPRQRQAAADFLRRTSNTDETESRPTLVQLVARTKPAVVEIDVEASDGEFTGTGFFISPDGYCVTASHVVEEARSVEATTNDGTQYFAQRVAYLNKDADIAIVKFNCRNVAYLDPRPSDAEEGQAIVVIGSPRGFAGTVSTGIVSAKRLSDKQDDWLIQITAPVSHGSSGSPVLDEDGYVVGVVLGSFEEGQSINFASSQFGIFAGMEAVKELRHREGEILGSYSRR